jgi:hypothetical protein
MELQVWKIAGRVFIIWPEDQNFSAQLSLSMKAMPHYTAVSLYLQTAGEWLVYNF